MKVYTNQEILRFAQNDREFVGDGLSDVLRLTYTTKATRMGGFLHINYFVLIGPFSSLGRISACLTASLIVFSIACSL